MAPISLTPDQIRMLQQSFFTPAQIQQISNGQAPPNVQAAASRVLANSGSFLGGDTGSRQVNSISPGGTGGNIFDKIGSLGSKLANPIGTLIDAIGTGGYRNSTTPLPAGSDRKSGGSGTFPRSTGPYDPFGGDTIPKGTGPASKSNGPTRQNSVGGIFKRGGGASTDTGSSVPAPPVFEGMPSFPDLGPYTVPVVTPRDFTDQATELTDKAFQPLFDSLNASKTNIGEQGVRTQQIVGGLYDNLRNDIAEQAAKTANEYQGRQQQTQQAGETLGKQIGGNYQAANADTASTLANLGLGAAAPEVTQQNTADQAWQQGQAATNTQAQGAYYGQQAQGQADYDAQLGNIAGMEGAVQQGNVANQVSQMLAGVDQNIASNQAQKGQLALTIASQLSDQDLAAQQANAGYAVHGQDSERQAKLDAYKAAADAAVQNNQISQQTYQNIIAQIQQEFENTRAINNDVLTQSNADRQAEIDRERILASSLPGGSSGSGGSSSDSGDIKPTGPYASRGEAEGMFPGQGSKMYDAAIQMAQSYGPGSGKTGDDFMQMLRYKAVNDSSLGFDQNNFALIGLKAYQDMWGKFPNAANEP